MSPSRWAVLVLVLVALGVSLGYGLKSKGSNTNKESLAPLQKKAALDPCPGSLGPAFPDLTLPCLGGGADVHLRGTGTGIPTLVNVYGSWCLPCLKEMPVLRTFYDKAKDRVALVGVDTQEREPSQGLRFATDVGQHWPAVVDDERLVGSRYSPGVPLMLFVDPAGQVVHVEHRSGYQTLAALEADVQHYLGVTA